MTSLKLDWRPKTCPVSPASTSAIRLSTAEGADWAGNARRVLAAHPNWTGMTRMVWDGILRYLCVLLFKPPIARASLRSGVSEERRILPSSNCPTTISAIAIRPRREWWPSNSSTAI